MIAIAAVEFIPLPTPHIIFQNREKRTKVILSLIQVTEPSPNIEIIYTRELIRAYKAYD
jgi:hypothetical protein